MKQIILFFIIEMMMIVLAGFLFDKHLYGNCISISLSCIIVAIMESCFLICRILNKK